MVQKCKKSLIFFTHFMKFHALCSDPNFPGSRGCYPGKRDSQNSKIPGISRDGKSRAEALLSINLNLFVQKRFFFKKFVEF